MAAISSSEDQQLRGLQLRGGAVAGQSEPDGLAFCCERNSIIAPPSILDLSQR